MIYLDANSFYAYAMPKLLPMGRFKRTDPKEFDMNKYICNS